MSLFRTVKSVSMLRLSLLGSILVLLSLFMAPDLKGQHRISAHERLESLAAALNPNDTPTISALTDSVFSVPHYLDMPAAAIALLKPKIESAEIAYWRGRHPGVRESDIVEAVNELSDVLKLPEQARTTESQIHELRMKSLFMNPRFMGLRIANREDKPGKFQISEVMSPLQATHLLLTLVDVKFLMEEYQVTPAEWVANHAQASASTAADRSTGTVRTNNTPRTRELQQGLNSGLAALSDLDGLDLLLKTLRHFGIA